MRIVFGILALVLAALPARAENFTNLGNGQQSPGSVLLCQTSGTQYLPCSSTTPLPTTMTAGSAVNINDGFGNPLASTNISGAYRLNVQTLGIIANGTAAGSYVTEIGGTDGTNTRMVSTDTTGRVNTLLPQVTGTVAAGTAAGNSLLGGCVYNSTVPAPTTGQQIATQCDSNANAKVNAGNTVTVCVTPTVTAANAYGTNYSMGGISTFTNMFTSKQSGILQAVTVTIKKVETSGFTFVPFSALPANAMADAAAASINAADVFLVRNPIALSAYSGLGTHTVASAVGLGQAMASSTTSLYGILITSAALTNNLGSTSDVNVCATVLQDL